MDTTTTPTSNTLLTPPELSQKEIERLVERGGRFLRAVGTRAAIMRDIAEAGYNLKEHHLGWELFLKVCGYNPVGQAEAARSVAQLAMDELDAWDGPAFARSAAALGRLFPAQDAYLFAGLDAKTGIGSVASCKTYLDRVDVLRAGKDDDKAAVALLEERGVISPDIEKHLRELIEQAMQLTDPPPTDDTREREVQTAAQNLKAWLDDWRATAAATIDRRDHLISLGLASRRASSTDDAADEPTPDEPTAPAPT